MLFNSYIFILLFLPSSLIGYYLCNRIGEKLIASGNRYNLGHIWLLGMSLWFYAYFNLKYLLIIIISILFNYFASNMIKRQSDIKIKKIFLFLTISANLLALGYYKYYDFFVANINKVFDVSFNFHYLILPLGISFFTFQQLAYVIDSHKGETPDYSFLDYALFVAFFPPLIAGPIVSHNELIPQFSDISKKKLNYENFSKGLMAFSYGLFKKVIIADTFGSAVGAGYSNIALLNTTEAIIVMFSYTIQIYFDFSGYCDMATGIGLMFNIKLPMNFNSPYKALSIIDFWKRWHMTLTRFFMKYVYIPLGGNRKGKLWTYINIMGVFLLSGLWHGANWTFVLWGTFHGILNILNRIFTKWIDKIAKPVRWLFTFVVINILWIFFRAPSISDAMTLIQKIFKLDFRIRTLGAIADGFNLPELAVVFNVVTGENIFKAHSVGFMLAFILFSFIAIIFLKNTNESINNYQPTILQFATCIGITLWSVLSLAGVSTFLYYNF